MIIHQKIIKSFLFLLLVVTNSYSMEDPGKSNRRRNNPDNKHAGSVLTYPPSTGLEEGVEKFNALPNQKVGLIFSQARTKEDELEMQAFVRGFLIGFCVAGGPLLIRFGNLFEGIQVTSVGIHDLLSLIREIYDNRKYM